MDYYFLGASLPMLSLDATAPLSPEQFVTLCEDHLSDRDMILLRAILADSPDEGCRGTFIEKWQAIETCLRNSTTKIRASRLDRDASEFLREENIFDPSIERAVSDAYGESSPLRREMALDAFRWDQAEALAGFNPFSIDAILSYAIKLSLCKRWAEMNEETGKNKTEQVITGESGDIA